MGLKYISVNILKVDTDWSSQIGRNSAVYAIGTPEYPLLHFETKEVYIWS